jgi:hypothetical protein
LHTKELIELENAISIDNVKNVIIYNLDDFDTYIRNKENYNKIEKLWVYQDLTIYLDSKEIELLNKKHAIYIPCEYYSTELRDVAE